MGKGTIMRCERFVLNKAAMRYVHCIKSKSKSFNSLIEKKKNPVNIINSTKEREQEGERKRERERERARARVLSLRAMIKKNRYKYENIHKILLYYI